MRRCIAILVLGLLLATAAHAEVAIPPLNKLKPLPEQILEQLKAGNKRFVAGKTIHPNSGPARIAQGGKESQADHALATVIGCSDSRCPLERIFDVGIMDIFVVRVAGNVVRGDEAGSIEYGLAHVKTPVLVVLGHTQCGAVTAVTEAKLGKGGHGLERNIPALVSPIGPAVKRAMAANPGLQGQELVVEAIVENVWQAVEDLFLQSPATRQMVRRGQVKVAPAIYDVASGRVHWLPEDKVAAILAQAEANPIRALNAMAEDHGPEQAHDAHAAAPAGHATPAAAHGAPAAHAVAAPPADPRVDDLDKQVQALAGSVGLGFWLFPALLVAATGGSVFFTFRRTRTPKAPVAEKPQVH